MDNGIVSLDSIRMNDGSGIKTPMKVAVVHDWLTLTGGAERVLSEILRIYPQADIFCVVCFSSPTVDKITSGHKVTTSFVQRLPRARKWYRSYLPFMPIAIEQFDFSGYDLVISSSHAVAKGVITGPKQLHIAYVHSPIRYAWDLQGVYLREAGLERGLKSWFARLILHYIRMWDTRTSFGVDRFISNSHFIRRRIKKVYGRDAVVIYPPVDTERFAMGTERDDFYVTASRMVPYKCIPVIAAAFAMMPDKKLIIIGDGPDLDLVRAAAGLNVTLVGFLGDDEVADYFSRAKAFVFAAEEDFGIVPLEAQACGAPVIAYGAGGSLETIRGENADMPTGVFFQEQTAQSIRNAVERFEALAVPISSQACRANAERFSTARFSAEIRGFIDQALDERRLENLAVDC